MATEIKMPQLSDTMDAGKILAWKKNEGDTVNRGEILAEVETDKANLEIECFQPGTLLKIVAPVGVKAKVGEVIAIIGAAGESVSTQTQAQPTQMTAPQSSPVQAAPAQPAQVQTSAAPVAPQTNFEPAPMHVSSDERLKASPLARKLAEEKQVDLRALRGSGPGGRIIKKDIEQAAPGGSATRLQAQAAEPIRLTQSLATATLAPAANGLPGAYTPLSRMRETIARRMQESVQQSPHFFLTVAIDMQPAIKLQSSLKEQKEFEGVSLTHLVIKAAAFALRQEPGVNCSIRDGQIFAPQQINIGIVVAVPDGLMIPVVREADKLALKDTIFEAKAAVERARAGRPSSADLSGGTFSISNLGMFDVENFTAIINPGQGAILAISSVKEEAVVESGALRIGKRMKATLSADHRVVDGVTAAKFMRQFKAALEQPALIFI